MPRGTSKAATYEAAHKATKKYERIYREFPERDIEPTIPKAKLGMIALVYADCAVVAIGPILAMTPTYCYVLDEEEESAYRCNGIIKAVWEDVFIESSGPLKKNMSKETVVRHRLEKCQGIAEDDC